MYCGCNEVAESSQARIARALISLMERKSFSSVSISEICREAGVSRPTFYSLFDSLEDVVRYILHASYCYKPEVEPTEEYSMAVFCRGYGRYISENRTFLSLLMRRWISTGVSSGSKEAREARPGSPCGIFAEKRGFRQK